MSKLSCTNKVDNDVNNDDEKYFATPRKQNHSATAICDTNTTTDQVHLEVNLPPCQKSPPGPKTSLKISPSEREYLFFKLMEELISQHSFPNQGH